MRFDSPACARLRGHPVQHVDHIANQAGLDDDVSAHDMKAGGETGGRVPLVTPTYSIVLATAWPDRALIIVKSVP